MDYTINKLSITQEQFLNNLSNYLDKKLYFYGSVQRQNFFYESDINIAIFTDNISSTLIKFSNFLQIKKTDIKKFVWKLNKTNYVIHGYKYMYVDKENKFKFEFSIYNEKYKEDLLNEYKVKIYLPFYAIILLNIIKILYYKLEIISGKSYKYYKRFILSWMIWKEPDMFVVL